MIGNYKQINDIGIIDFFEYLNQITNMFVTAIEIKPIKIKKDTYITGFKRTNVTQIEAHVKHIKQFMTKVNEHTMKMMLKDTPETEMWMDVELLDIGVVRTAFNELRNHFYKLDGFEVAQLQYKLKSETNNLCTQEEVIIYDDKHNACKETVAKRKLCSIFKSHFSHFGEKKENDKLTDEEIAEMA